MSSKLVHAIVLAIFATALPLAANGETMTIADYLSGRSDFKTTTESASNDNPFEDISLSVPDASAQVESLKDTGLEPYRIEPPDVIAIDVDAEDGEVSSESPAEIRDAIGRRLVQPDGKINLGQFGDLYVSGMTTDQASRAIQKKIGKALPDGKIVVDIHAANSKRYYIIMQYSGPADEVMDCPATGNETVLDAIAQTAQAPRISKVWISRRSSETPGGKILPVDWEKVRDDDSQSTNYALQPGDRVFVQMDAAHRGADIPVTPDFPDGKPPIVLILEGSSTGDYAYAVECPLDATVNAVLRKATFPNPIDFKTTTIIVHRPSQHINDDLTVEAEEQILRVEWDAKTGKPTEKTNYGLQPNDRLIVTLPASAARKTLPPAPTPVAVYSARQTPPLRSADSPPYLAATPPPAAPQAVVYSALPGPVPSPYAATQSTRAIVPTPGGIAPAVAAEPTQAKTSTVKFDVVIVEDVGDSFAEFDQLRSRMPFMLTDTATMQGTLRILEKHNLVRRVADPQLMVVVGEKATIAIGNEKPDTDQPWQGIKAEMGARELGGGLAVDFQLENTECRSTNKVQTSLIVPHGQTVVMKTRSKVQPDSTGDDTVEDKVEPAVYVVLTPEIVRK